MQTNEELATAIQNGDNEKIIQLWEQCYNFIRLQADRWYKAWKNRPCFDTDDLIQSGYIALMEAVKAFQADKGCFINLLAFYLKTEFSKVVGCRTQAQMREPLFNAISLDAPVSNDEEGEITIGDTIPFEETGFEEAENAMCIACISKVVKEALCSLPEKQRIAIEAHFLNGKTYKEIADALKVSCSFPGQLVKDGLKGLRNSKYAPTLSELLWGQRNFYKHTGYTAWKESGCSVQEWSVIWKEKEIRRHKLKDTRGSKIRYCVDVLGMDRGQAESLFPV